MYGGQEVGVGALAGWVRPQPASTGRSRQINKSLAISVFQVV
jgi:hypothetical protein